ncbi:hypothetical protein AAVH_24281, partial [Aphelenchoides avenae]
RDRYGRSSGRVRHCLSCRRCCADGHRHRDGRHRCAAAGRGQCGCLVAGRRRTCGRRRGNRGAATHCRQPLLLLRHSV